MKKIFRMQYESCTGACYAPDQEFFQLLKDSYINNRTDFDRIVKNLLTIHNEVCGNSQLSYMIDFDEETKLYIASFLHYGSLELLVDKDIFKCLQKLVRLILAYYETPEYKFLKLENPGHGAHVCEHGEDQKLASFIVKCVQGDKHESLHTNYL